MARLAHMHQDRGEHRDRHEGDHTHDVDWDAVSARLKEAVERGAMTQAQADQVMADMKRRLEDGHEH